MPSAAEFLKAYTAPKEEPAAGATASAPASDAAPQKKSAAEFISRATGKPYTPPKKPANDANPQESSWENLPNEMVEAFADPTFEVGRSIAEDWEASKGKFASPEATEKYRKSGVVDRLKSDAKEYLATAKLPLDIASEGPALASGLFKGLVAAPAAHLLESTQSHEHPSGYVPAYTDKYGKKHEAEVLSPEALKAYQKQLTQPQHKQDYFKDAPNRPRPQITSSVKDIQTGIMGMADAATALWIPEDVAAFRAPGGAGATKVPRSAFSNFTTRSVQTAEDFAKRKIAGALKVGGMSKEEARAKLSKPGMSISDLGDDKMIQLGEQAALSGEGRRLGSNLYIEERKKGRQGRVAEAVNKLANDKNMYEHLDELKESQIANARPLYKQAFEYSNPLQIEKLTGHLEESFSKASKAVNDAMQEVRDAENMVTMANARYPGESSNAAQTTARNAALRDANRRKLLAEEKLDQAKEGRETALERLNTLQNHEENGVMGGLWSERLDELMSRPFVTSGVARGIEIQKNEAAVASEAPRLNHYALKPGANEENPIVSPVPNLRLLDAMKRGMDAHIRDLYTNKLTGKLELNELGRSQQALRDEFVKEVDRLAAEGGNNAYKGAREAWAGPAGIMDAVHDGANYKKLAPELLAKKVAKMTPGELEGYRIGVVRDIADDVAKGTTQALTVARSIVDNKNHQKQLQIILGEEQAAHIMELAQREVDFAERGSRIVGGSPTQRLSEGSKDFQSTGSEALDDVVGTFKSQGGGMGTLSPSHLALSWVTRWGGRVLQGMTQARRDAVAKLLFSTNREDNLAAIDMIYDEGMMTLPDYPKTKKAIFGGAVTDLARSHGQSKEEDAPDDPEVSQEPAPTP